MAIINQILVEVYDVVERAARLEARNGVGSMTERDQAAATTTSPSASATTTGNSGGSSGGQSPLLFFVALGFGVVFTNLWIIVGVKYCFRYNARNRAIARGENVDEVPLDNVPAGRPHRRRREKKLMTMDEVNERFPMMKYKTWIASRVDQGLSTEGGVTAPASRPTSLREADGVVPVSPVDTKHTLEGLDAPAPAYDAIEISPAPVATTAAARRSMESSKSAHVSHEEVAATGNYESQRDTKNVMPSLHEVPTAGTVDDSKDAHAKEVDSDDDDDHIHDALPVEMLDSPGDSCAICIDTLEQDDDIRGLTCGHVFHAGCLDPWLTSRRACCPLCKADYYIPKPKPEGEAAAAAEGRDRSGRRRAGGPAAPPQSYSGWRGFRGSGRHVFSGFLPSNPANYDGGGYGYAQGSRRPRGSARANERYRREAAQAASAARDGRRPGAPLPTIEFVNPFVGMRRPRFGLPSRRQENIARMNQENAQQDGVTPSQLEQGISR